MGEIDEVIERIEQLEIEKNKLEQKLEQLQECDYKIPVEKFEGTVNDELIKRLVGNRIKEYEYLEKCNSFNSWYCEECKTKFCIDVVDDINNFRSPIIGFDFMNNTFERFGHR